MTTQILIFIIMSLLRSVQFRALIKIIFFFLYFRLATDCVDVSMSVKLKFKHVILTLPRLSSACYVEEPFSVSRESIRENGKMGENCEGVVPHASTV